MIRLFDLNISQTGGGYKALSGDFPGDILKELLKTGFNLTVVTLNVAWHLSFVFNPGATCSNTETAFLLVGLISSSGSPESNFYQIGIKEDSPSKPGTLTRSPGTAPAGGAKISTFSGVEAHMTIASETIPLIFAGLRLQRRTTIRFCISSKGTCLTRPEMTVRGLSSPHSICSRYKASASEKIKSDLSDLLLAGETRQLSRNNLFFIAVDSLDLSHGLRLELVSS